MVGTITEIMAPMATITTTMATTIIITDTTEVAANETTKAARAPGEMQAEITTTVIMVMTAETAVNNRASSVWLNRHPYTVADVWSDDTDRMDCGLECGLSVHKIRY